MHKRLIITALLLVVSGILPAADVLAQFHNEGQETWFLTLNHYHPTKTRGYATIPVVKAFHPAGGRTTFTADPGYSLEGLTEGFRRMTSMEVYHGGILPLDSPSLSRYPVIAVAAFGTMPTDSEIIRLRKYIDDGGFVILGEGVPKKRKALFVKGVSIRPIPSDHPIYDCFFQREELDKTNTMGGMGIWKKGRLVGISSMALFNQWSQPVSMIPEVSMKQSVNIVVYALMQGME